MNVLNHAWLALREPTLQRRSVGFVMLAFFVVWAALVGYAWIKYQRTLEEEQPYQKYGAAVLEALDQIADPGQAAAALGATEHWLNIRRRQIGLLPGRAQFELRDLDGRLLRGHIDVDRGPHRSFEGKGVRWQLRIAEPARSVPSFLRYNAQQIGEYLLLATPFVLLAVWLSVRGGLRPLQQFADRIARRAPDDLSPLGAAPLHLELRPLRTALDGLLERLRQRLARERQFVQEAAHEIRTPLAVVLAQAHVLAQAPSTQERQRAYGVLAQAIARASHVARQLLTLATFDDAQRASTARTLDVAQATREILAQLAPQALARGMELSLEAPDRLPMPLDEGAYASILQNLVDNAIRHGRDGGTVAVTLRGDEERLCVHVQDDGPGIRVEDQALVFERFYRCAGTEAAGSGLGLAIVRQAASRMGGRAVVTDGLERRGVGFLVSVPVPGFVPG